MEKLYQCKDVAKRYGVKTLTVWAWIREGKLTAMSINGRYRIRESDLAAFEGRTTTEERLDEAE